MSTFFAHNATTAHPAFELKFPARPVVHQHFPHGDAPAVAVHVPGADLLEGTDGVECSGTGSLEQADMGCEMICYI